MQTSTAPVHTKHFTYTEAVSALVLVRPIVSDIVSKHSELLALRDGMTAVAEEQNDKFVELETKFKELSEELHYHIEELAQVGCLLKSPRGLVDFPSIHKGEEIYLCWQFGEGTISHYHSVGDSFKGRKTVPFDME